MERAHTLFQIIRSLFLLAILVLPGGEALAQSYSGDMLANELRPNVVRVIVRWTDGSQKGGFGFVVGERAGLLYIATAFHVVQKDSEAGTSTIIFYQDQGKEYQGDLLTTHLVDIDLAVIRVQPPPGFAWQATARSGIVAERGDDVRFIGVEGQWLVPFKPGAVNTVDPGHAIRFEGLVIRPGTSGAPLVGNKGIVGMITTDDVFGGYATPIDAIERAIRGWNYPWQLTAWSPPQQHAAVEFQQPPTTQPGPPALPPRPQSAAPSLSAPPKPPPEIVERHYTTRDNRDLWLGDIARPDNAIGRRNIELAECEQECSNNSDCIAFAYDRWNRACYPKNKITQSFLDPHSMIAVKKPTDLPNVSQKTFEMVILRNRRMKGDVVASNKVADYASCSSACQNSIKCVTFNFLKRSSPADNCQLFNLSDGHDSDAAVDAGYKRQVP